uniref:Galectin n=1 Tax=Glossina brevipalpis TaxID=37001 RepID=A0A1A9W0I9_9MUSC
MSALFLYVTSSFYDLYEFITAFVRCGYDVEKSLCYLKTKKRLQLFQYYCRQYWINKCIKTYRYKKEQQMQKFFVHKTNVNLRKIMQRSSIDFDESDVIEEGFECTDSFGADDNDSNFETFPELDFENIDIHSLDECTTVLSDGKEELVYYNPRLMRLHEGVSLTVNGITKPYCERFSINLIIENSTRDVALHINPRLPQGYIVRNSKVNNVWGDEEKASPLPFNLKRDQIGYMISVNGYHFCKFLHRLPYRDVGTLEVKGDVDDIKVERLEVQNYPERLPQTKPALIRLGRPLKSTYNDNFDEGDGDAIKAPGKWRRISMPTRVTLAMIQDKSDEDEIALPFYGMFPRGTFTLGRVLRIEGRIKLLPHSFYINLQTGCDVWPHPTVAFHLNPRFAKQHGGIIGRTTLVRNAWMEGSWGMEDRSDIDTEFRPGKAFSLCIVSTKASFQIYLNHRFLTEFKYRVTPEFVDTVYIQGDIKLWDVMLANELSFEAIKPERKIAFASNINPSERKYDRRANQTDEFRGVFNS